MNLKMKGNTRTIIFLLNILLPIFSWAIEENPIIVDGIYYEKISGTFNLKVTYDPAKKILNEVSEEVGNTYTGEITVPSNVAYEGVDYTVTEIGELAFSGCPGLTRINLPETITIIGDKGFYGNPDIEEMVLPSSLRYIGYYGFRNCYNLKSINFPEGLEYIGMDAFTHDRNLTELILPSSLKQIGNYAFCACTGVKRVILTDGDEPLEKVYEYGNGYRSIFDQMVVDYAYIGRSCYEDGDTYLPIHINTRELELGDTSYSTFPKGMVNGNILEKLILPASVTTFREDTNLLISLKELILKDGEQPLFIGKSGNFGQAGIAAFVNCPIEKAYVGRMIETSWNSDMPFHGCKSLKELTIGNSMTEIQAYSFIRCEGLQKVTLPTSIRKLGDGCFSDCYELTSIKLPNALTEIPYRAFDSCFKLKEVEFGENVRTIGELAFSNNGFTELRLPGTVSEVGKNSFSFSRGITKIELPQGLETIGEMAFSHCENVSEVLIPGSVKLIKQYAFQNLPNLKKIRFESGDDALATAVEAWTGKSAEVFNGSTEKLKEIYLNRNFRWDTYSGSSGQTIFDYIDFWGAYWRNFDASPRIIIGADVSLLGTNLFNRFGRIESIVCEGKDMIPHCGDNEIRNKWNITLYVPFGYKDRYLAYSCWRGFKEINEVDISEVLDVEDIENLKSGISIEDGKILINPCLEKYNLKIFDIKGSMLLNEIVYGESFSYRPKSHGVYIIMIDSKVYKIKM